MKLKGDIARKAQIYGGAFTSHQILDEPDRPDLYNQWLDFCFPGRDKFTLWNATIETARSAFWAAAENLAFERTIALLPVEALEIRAFEPCTFSPTGKVTGYRLKEAPRHEELGGTTLAAYAAKLEAEIIHSEPPSIYESFTINRSYAYGIGLHIIVDVDVIDHATVEGAIDHFRRLGETAWHSATPVPRERLPVQTQNEALAAIKYEPDGILMADANAG